MGDNKRYERPVTRSLAEAIPFISDETRGGIDQGLARVLAGMKSQLFGLDKQGNVDPFALLRGGETREEMMRRIIEGGRASRDEKSLPGFLNSVLALPSMVLPDKYAPERSKRAVKRQEELFGALRADAGLGEPHGFVEKALESAGEMLGQLPVGAVRVGKAAGPAKRMLGSIPEYLFPTIEPSVGNYTAGTIAGGALKTMAEPGKKHADGGRVSVLGQALARLEKMLAGEQPTTESIGDLLEGLRGVQNVPVPTRQRVHNVVMRRDLPEMLGRPDAAQAQGFNDQLLNQLAEIYMASPDVGKVRARVTR